METIKIEKEGKYWTLYINDVQCSCGDLEDVTDEFNNAINRTMNGDPVEDIIAYYNDFR